jgi:molecular chaperone GrpE
MARIPINDDERNAARADPGDDAAAQAPDLDEGPEAPTGTRPGTAGGGEAQQLRAERDDLYQRLARATADFKNTQRRLEAELDQRVQYANQSLIKSLLPVIDNFERALSIDPAKTDVATLLKGMQIVHDQWIAVLRQQNVEEIAPQPGEAFDPNQHEALMQQDAPPEFAGKGPTVVQMLQKGYRLRDRTIRPAQVAVSKSQ